MRKLTKTIIINSGIYEDRVAVLESGKLEDFSVEQGGTEQLYGNVYKGIVESVVQGIGAAFVNIGTGKNGFLYISDVQDNPSFLLDEAEDVVVESKKKKKIDIKEILKIGQEIIVQVGKESIGTKGPRITTHISIPGRYLVFTPFDENLGVSKRIPAADERNRIRTILKSLNLPEGSGCIVRTAAQGISAGNLKREVKYLLNLWKRIQERSRRATPPAVLYEEYGLIMRTIRDDLTDDVEKVIVDSKHEYKNILRFLNLFMPILKNRVIFYNDKTPVLEKYGAEKEIERIFRRKILMKNGGSIIIEQTEGMVAIDVNTAKFTGKKNAEDTVFKTNMQAAKEIARQIKLRDIGGIIIIDFIDMRSRDHRKKVQDTFENALRKDKAKTKILNISPIGVVEMTRQRVRKSLEGAMYRECPYCSGRGLIQSNTTIAMQVLRKIERASNKTRGRQIDVWLNAEIYGYLHNNEKNLILPLRKKCRKIIKFHIDEKMHIEDVRIS